MRITLLALLVFAVLSGVLALGIGPTSTSPIKALSCLFTNGPEARILQELRAPRVLGALVVGGGLGLAGAVLQGMFRNPLADPYLLGVANGAASGVVAALFFGLSGPWIRPAAAFLGGILAVFLVWRLGGRGRELGLILAGIAVAAAFSALSGFLLLGLAARRRVEEFVFWSLGSLARLTWTELFAFGPVVLGAAGALLLWARDLNALSLGEEGALSVGVDPVWAQRILLGFATLLVSATSAFTGVVAFVGLITPHAVRLLLGPDHRFLLPASALSGGILLLWADAAARTIRAPAEMPLGLVTALLGAPFFLYLLAKELRGRP